MAEIRSNLDQVVRTALAKVDGISESLARRMGAAGGRVFRDQAKTIAPISEHGVSYPETSRGSKQSGTLRDAIYLAYKPDYSGPQAGQYVYRVSWNAKQAWWGKLLEFGYLQRYPVHVTEDGKFWTDKSRKLSIPFPVPARPFIGPAYTMGKSQALSVMLAVGREQSIKLLKGE